MGKKDGEKEPVNQVEEIPVQVEEDEDIVMKDIEPVLPSPTKKNHKSPNKSTIPPLAPIKSTSPRKRTRGGGDEDRKKIEKRDEPSPSISSPKKRNHEAKSSTPSSSTQDEKHKKFKKNAMLVWNKIFDHRCGPVFMKPPMNEYILCPMTLGKVKSRINNGEITTIPEFHRDLLLLFTGVLMSCTEDSVNYYIQSEILIF